MKVGSKIPPTDVRNVRDEFVFDNEISEVTIDDVIPATSQKGEGSVEKLEKRRKSEKFSNLT